MAKRAIGTALKKRVISRASGYCEYCKSPADFSTEPFSIEHIVPRSRQGTNDESNLAVNKPLQNADSFSAMGLRPSKTNFYPAGNFSCNGLFTASIKLKKEVKIEKAEEIVKNGA